jgi:hypothetical protein
MITINDQINGIQVNDKVICPKGDGVVTALNQRDPRFNGKPTITVKVPEFNFPISFSWTQVARVVSTCLQPLSQDDAIELLLPEAQCERNEIVSDIQSFGPTLDGGYLMVCRIEAIRFFWDGQRWAFFEYAN